MSDQELIEQRGCPECRRLKGLLERERAALARFLVPWRSHIPESWLKHFEQEGGVYFDEIGYVRARPVSEDRQGATTDNGVMSGDKPVSSSP